MTGTENSDDATPNDIADAENTATLREVTPELSEADLPESSAPFKHGAADEAINNAAKELSDGAAQPDAAASKVPATATDGGTPAPSDEPGPAEAHEAGEPDAVARDVTAQITDDDADQSDSISSEEPAASAAAEAKPAGGGSPEFCALGDGTTAATPLPTSSEAMLASATVDGGSAGPGGNADEASTTATSHEAEVRLRMATTNGDRSAGASEGAAASPSTIPIDENSDLHGERASKNAAMYREIVDHAVVAGESRSQYRAVHDGVIDEEKPEGLREHFITEQIAHSAWKARRLRGAGTSVWNAGIANDLHRKLVTLDAFGVAAGEKKTGKYKIWWEDSVKAKIGNGWLAWHQIAVAAVSGDKSALAIVEGKLGPGAVAIINASSEFDTILTSQTLIDRSMTAALADRDSGYRQLDKIAARRAKKNKKIKKDAAALLQIDATPVVSDAATPDDPSLIADVPLRSAAKSESQPGPSSSVTVLVPPALKKEA